MIVDWWLFGVGAFFSAWCFGCVKQGDSEGGVGVIVAILVACLIAWKYPVASERLAIAAASGIGLLLGVGLGWAAARSRAKA